MMITMKKQVLNNMEKNKVLEILKNPTKSNGTFTRVDSKHPLDLFLGTNELGQYTLLLLNKDQLLVQDLSSPIINVSLGERNDGNYAMSFTLLDNKYGELFSYLCSDLILTTDKINPNVPGVNLLVNRFLQWKKMFKKLTGELLSESEIKGLIGELYFLKNNLSVKYGIDVAVNSWIGPEKTLQDFVYDDCWYEIKSTSSKAVTVKISSVEQLDTNDCGKLVILYLDKTSKTDVNRISLNSIVDEIKETIENEQTKDRFDYNLMIQGYVFNQKYDDYNFKMAKLEMYNVDKEFPCVRKVQVPKTVKSVKYELIISELESWRDDEIR